MRKEQLSPLQIAFIAIGFTLGSSILFTTGVRFGGRATWIAEAASTVPGTAIIMMMSYITGRFPGKNLLEILTALTGGFLGLLYYVFFAVLTSALVISTIQNFFTTAILTETPAWVFCLTMALATGYVLRLGLEPAARCIQFILPPVIIILGLMFFAAFYFVKISYLLPLFTISTIDFARALIVLTSFPDAQMFLLASVALRANDYRKVLPALLLGYLGGSLFLILRPILSVGIFSFSEAKHFTFAIYMVARVIRFGQFLERIESFFLFLWFFIIFIKVAVCFYAALDGMSALFKINDVKMLVYPLCIFVIPFSINGYANYQEVPRYLSSALPALSFPVCFIKRKNLLNCGNQNPCQGGQLYIHLDKQGQPQPEDEKTAVQQ